MKWMMMVVALAAVGCASSEPASDAEHAETLVESDTEPAEDAATTEDSTEPTAEDAADAVDGSGDAPTESTPTWAVDPLRRVPATVSNGPCMDAHAADIDGDGDIDIALAMEGGTNVWLQNDGGGRFTVISDAAMAAVKADSEDALVGDLNGDGRADVLFVTEEGGTDELYLQNADGSFVAAPEMPPASVTNGAILVDLDDDQDLDVVLANRGQNTIWEQDGGALIAVDSLPTDESTSQDVEAGDIDGDGDLDLIFANEGPNTLWLQEPDGSFVDASAHLVGAVSETREVDLADLDGDEDLDIVLANVGWGALPGQNQVLEQVRTLEFVDRTADALPVSLSSTLDLDALDLDGDGDFDLVAAEVFVGPHGLTEAPVVALENRGEWRFETRSETWFPGAPESLGIDIEAADFDGDDIIDLYVCGRISEDLVLFGAPAP